jgi:hypothetical protein
MLIILSEENYLDIINSYNKAHWQPMLDLIPEIEASNRVIHIFQHLADTMGIMISFDWGSWQDGKDMLEGKTFDFNTIDIPTKCKLISMIIRNDRFCQGYLESTFKNGIILGILKSIEGQLGAF